MARVNFKTTKHQLVKSHLLSKGHITSWEAINDYGVTRLSAIIYNLRMNEGFQISSVKVPMEDRYGNEGTYAKYIYLGSDDTQYKIEFEKTEK